MNESKPPSQISSLIRLIDDRDAFVRGRVREQLIKLGDDALPFLEIAARSENSKVRGHAREIIQAMVPAQLGKKFRQLAESAPAGHMDLESGILLLAEFGYPGLDPIEVSGPLDRLANELSARVDVTSPPDKVVRELTRFLFEEKGFAGNTGNFLDPDNSYFNQLLQRKLGIPITLSALCVLVAGRLDLPIVGVGLPGRYIAKYDSATDPIYFDPFDGGRILSREYCEQLVQKMGYPFEEHQLSAATNGETLIRMMNNLVMIYSKTQEEEKARQLEEYIKILMKPRSNNPGKPA